MGERAKLKAVQYSPHYCPEAKGSPPRDWDSSHDLSIIANGKRYRVGSFKHAVYAEEVGKLIEEHGLPTLEATIAMDAEGEQ